MALSPFQQAQDLIKKSQNVLIVLPDDPSLDTISSGLALFSVLEKLKKDAKVVCADFRLPPNADFMPKSKDIHSSLTSLRQFIISLNVSQTAVEELSYAIEGEKLNIYITPRNGYFEERDVSTSSGAFTHEVIIVLGAPDLETLGKLYDDHAEFFYHTPIINIDHQAANENFGQVNLVEVTATSTSEIVFELIKHLGEEHLDEYIATNLLTGIITKTKSFQSPVVTPKSLAVASHLIASGARREEIVKNLYQTKTLPMLKLWGRTLARLRSAKNGSVLWSLLTVDDFVKSEASPNDLPGVIDELIVNAPEAKAIAILHEAPKNTVRGIIYTPHYIDATALFKKWHPEGGKDFTTIRAEKADLFAVEQAIIPLLEKELR
ncbi:MAG: hypothetical protein Q8Q20_05320 [bacterium]|nr:hypothetical protein [bacterium]